MDEMREVSSKAYRQHLTRDHNFLRYFKNITPQKVIEQLYIGSRPPKRNKSQEIKNLRAIPLGFCLDTNTPCSACLVGYP